MAKAEARVHFLSGLITPSLVAHGLDDAPEGCVYDPECGDLCDVVCRRPGGVLGCPYLNGHHSDLDNTPLPIMEAPLHILRKF